MGSEHDRESAWERLAQQDAPYYVDPTLSPGVSAKDFLAGGRGIVEWTLSWAGDALSRERALEIGCGLGRDTVHLAQHFEHVEGVDVSPTMVGHAQALDPPDNVTFSALSGRDLKPLADDTFTYAFSHLVFQHIAETDVIAGYLAEISRVLKPGGVAQLQFDTRRLSPAIGLVRRLPDRLLPRLQRRGIRRYGRDSEWIRGLGRQAGLVLEAERAPDSDQHWFRWRA
jgi:SAM-dependent methyltransferase